MREHFPWTAGAFEARLCFDPATLAAMAATAKAAAPAMMIGGTILSTVGAVQGGRAADAAAKYEARQLEASALVERATSQREANERRRETDLMISRSRAVGAASGGGLDFERIGDIAQEGEYRALTAMYEGEERAIGRTVQAGAARASGKSARRAGYIGGASTLLSGGNSLLEKYGNA